jgi:uncharacterized membrane protein YjgN (DUF898 family)
MRYYLIGGDGLEYGPVDTATLKTWIATNRADARSRVRAEDSADWKTVADFPELAAAITAAAPAGGAAAGTAGTATPHPALPDPRPAPDDETAAAHVPIEFRGEWKEFFRIWIVNLLLTVATLGIYAAWAKVRTRRYFYANTRLFGHAFDYLANPRRILAGNLIVAALFLIYSFSQLISPLVTVAMIAVFLLLVPWFIVRGATFNARNTSWRGLRFGFNGGYGRAFLVFILAPIGLYPTLGFLFPAWEKWRREFVINNHTYGTTPFALNLDTGSLYKWFFTAIGIMLAVLIPTIFASVIIGVMTHQLGGGGGGGTNKAGIMVVMALVYILYIAVFFVIGSFWKARVFTLAWNNTRLGPLVFHAGMRCRDLLLLRLGNFALLLFSLGLLYPLVKVRTLRFQLASVTVENWGDLDTFVASSRPTPGALGDAATDFWDFDIGFGL